MAAKTETTEKEQPKQLPQQKQSKRQSDIQHRDGMMKVNGSVLSGRRSSVLLSLLVALLAAVSTKAIYTEELWEHSVKLEEHDFNVIVQDEIDSGRTMFVRFIASPK